MIADPKPLICFVSMEAYATLRPGIARDAGGSGLQVVQLGQGLRDAGHPVSYVVGDYGQDFREEFAGFRIYRANKVSYDRSMTRALRNLVRLFKAMRAAGADYYVLRSTRFLAFFVMVFARLLGARYVFMAASRSHCVREELENLPPLFKRLYALSLRGAYAVTAQTNDQVILLAENFGIQAHTVPNCLDVPDLPDPLPEPEWDAAWIASIKTVKRPDRLLRIAEAAPDLRFVVAGGPGHDQAYFEEMTERLSALPNVDYVGFVPPDQVVRYYAGSSVYLMTSDYEGFPNTFLYAWSRGRPVVSTGVDPDRLLSERGLGIVGGETEDLIERLRALLADPGRYGRLSRDCYDYVSSTHTVAAAVAAFTESVVTTR